MTKCNFAGDENAGASWTQKILANKTDQEKTGKSVGQGDGADDEEWVRFSAQLKMFCVLLWPHLFRNWVYHEQMCNRFNISCYSIIKRFKIKSNKCNDPVKFLCANL